jgi:hypothetical protein
VTEGDFEKKFEAVAEFDSEDTVVRVFAGEGVRAVEDDKTLEGVARLERDAVKDVELVAATGEMETDTVEDRDMVGECVGDFESREAD